jgi:biopolymer transport protein ExbB
MEMVNDDLTMEMEHRTTYLATVGTLGPMIGLVGTVYGMILSFRVMATAGGSPQASLLAAGISTALFATLEGIALAVPAIALYAFFRNRIARLSLEVEIAAESFLEQFAPGVRPPHPLVTTAGQQRTALGGPPANG